MRNAFGSPQSVAVVGGTSEIGLAVVRRLCDAGTLQRVLLAGRDPVGLEAAAREVKEWGPGDVRTVGFEAAQTDAHDEVVRELFSAGDVDLVVLAFGMLGAADGMLDAADDAVRVAQVNYVAGVSMGLRVCAEMTRRGHGTLVVLSSVAGERGRAGNFVYGSSKAGLDTFAQGLGDRLHGSGVQVIVVRPGFVRTRMTKGLPEAPLACDPADVADAVARAVRTGQETVWVPASLRVVMSGLRHAPRAVFRRLPL